MARSRPGGWCTDTELVRVFDRPVDVVDAVVSSVAEAIERWPELSETPPLADFVDVAKLDGLFETKAVASSGNCPCPSAEFQFQDCRVTVLYGRTLRIIVSRDG